MFLKVSAVLITYALLLCHAHHLQATPTRSNLDTVSLSDSESRRLLNALLREFVQMSAEEEASSLERPLLVKRCSGLSTCVLGKLSQDLHKLQTFPRTNVGSGTPGRKRSSAYQSMAFRQSTANHNAGAGRYGPDKD
ncbi:unnamed protein product [Knipowitschia caucasica]|uniref:Calcitonin peptide-like domain-containing protein n=1 Tax=Knipowitschia caucasica TaxID=637954 RepID=A0AAV2KXU4_KNICA